MSIKKENLLSKLQLQFFDWISDEVIRFNMIQNKDDIYFEFQLKDKQAEQINYNPNRNEPIFYKDILITKIFNPRIPISFNVKSFLSIEPYIIFNNFPGIFSDEGITEYINGNKAPWRSIINKFFSISIFDGIHLKSTNKSSIHFEKYFEISIASNLQIILDEKLNFNPMGIYHILFFIIQHFNYTDNQNSIRNISLLFHDSFTFICTRKKIDAFLSCNKIKTKRQSNIHFLAKLFPELKIKINYHDTTIQ
jgi:hypothetical protein